MRESDWTGKLVILLAHCRIPKQGRVFFVWQFCFFPARKTGKANAFGFVVSCGYVVGGTGGTLCQLVGQSL
jgi:hypothetical protein